MNLDGFNAENHEPSSYEPLPKGWYTVIITDSEQKPTKAGDGSYLQLTLEVVDGDHKGRLLWDRLNLDNPNDTAVQIANKNLSAICRAVGVMRPKSSEDLHNKPLAVRVIQKEFNGDTQNEVKGYKGLRDPSASDAAPTTQPTPTSGRNDTPPWKRTA